VLIETTDLGFADVAFAAGFASVRQFNDTIREVYAATPTALRAGAAGRREGVAARAGSIRTRIAVREPFAAAELHHFLAVHAVRGIEATGTDWYERSLRLPHGPTVVRVDLSGRTPGQVPCWFTLTDARDLAPAMERTRRLLDADCDPVAVDAALAEDPTLAPLVARRRGLRVPGQLDGAELAVQTVLGQQVSLAAARTAAARLVEDHGERLELPGERTVTHLFPRADTIADLPVEQLRMPRSRARALTGLGAALAHGDVRLDRSTDRAETRAALLALPGIGPWTADYIAMRALGDPDVFLPTDVGVRNATAALGFPGLGEQSASWRPWRSYALMRLWSVVLEGMDGVGHTRPPRRQAHPPRNGDVR
jgi:AraC family transcriptional regulator of adaptative response / DNA-3-methyladenine glycosylase II